MFKQLAKKADRKLNVEHRRIMDLSDRGMWTVGFILLPLYSGGGGGVAHSGNCFRGGLGL
jgi:hypothetical protein